MEENKEEKKISDTCKSCIFDWCKCDREYCPNHTTPAQHEKHNETIFNKKWGR